MRKHVDQLSTITSQQNQKPASNNNKSPNFSSLQKTHLFNTFYHNLYFYEEQYKAANKRFRSLFLRIGKNERNVE